MALTIPEATAIINEMTARVETFFGTSVRDVAVDAAGRAEAAATRAEGEVADALANAAGLIRDEVKADADRASSAATAAATAAVDAADAVRLDVKADADRAETAASSAVADASAAVAAAVGRAEAAAEEAETTLASKADVTYVDSRVQEVTADQWPSNPQPGVIYWQAEE